MNVGECRTLVLDTVLGDTAGIPLGRLDRAIRAALEHALRLTKCSKTTYTMDLTANVAAVSTATLTGFSPRRLLEAQIGDVERGAWADATAYAVGDQVTSASIYYRCVRAHTSASGSIEPTDTTYWTRLEARTRSPVEIVKHVELLDKLARPTFYNELLENDGRLPASHASKYRLAFEHETTGLIRPVPDKAYKLFLVAADRLVTWTIGSTAGGVTSTTINLPDDILEQIVPVGVPAYLQAHDPAAAFGTPALLRYEQLLAEIAGESDPDQGDLILDENALL